MALIIRPYEERDKESLVGCMDKLHKYIAALDPLKRSTDVFEDRKKYVDWLLTEVKEKNGILLVATDTDTFGFIAGVIAERTLDDELHTIPSKAGRVNDLFVDDAYRGQGIGTRLMGALEDYFTEQGCDVSLVQVFAHNTHAAEFYHRHGYEDRAVDMLKKI